MCTEKGGAEEWPVGRCRADLLSEFQDSQATIPQCRERVALCPRFSNGKLQMSPGLWNEIRTYRVMKSFLFQKGKTIVTRNVGFIETKV